MLAFLNSREAHMHCERGTLFGTYGIIPLINYVTFRKIRNQLLRDN